MGLRRRGTGGRTIDQRINEVTSVSDDSEALPAAGAQSPTCWGVRPACTQFNQPAAVCADCLFLHEQQFRTPADIEFLRHCRSIRQYVEQSVSAIFSPYVAAFLVANNGHIQEMDARSAEFLKTSGVLKIRHNRLGAADSDFNEQLLNAISRVATTGEAETLLCGGDGEISARYTVLLQVTSGSDPSPTKPLQTVACLIFPLGRRRIASARQLIAMFGLSAAEARLARALCHGETLEEFAVDQGVKISTVKTQLRAVFSKTQTDRQVALVNLITGIPPLR